MENYIALYAKVRKILCGKLAKGYICTIDRFRENAI